MKIARNCINGFAEATRERHSREAKAADDRRKAQLSSMTEGIRQLLVEAAYTRNLVPRSDALSEVIVAGALTGSFRSLVEGGMTASNPITDKELGEVFQDDPEFGLRLLYTDFRDRIARYIKSRLWGLPPGIRAEEVKDVFQETMAALVPFVRNPDFDWREPLRIVFDIAKKKAASAVRKRKFRPKQDVDGAIEQIAKDLAGTKIGLEWRLQTQAEWKEFCSALHDAVSTVLTEKQAIVARCYVDNYEDFGEREIYAPLARLVGEITGEDENAVTIKKLWQEAKKRLVRELTRKGFKFLETEE